MDSYVPLPLLAVAQQPMGISSQHSPAGTGAKVVGAVVVVVGEILGAAVGANGVDSSVGDWVVG
jgi:hypothetical protein